MDTFSTAIRRHVTIIALVMVFALSIPAWRALVHPGFFPTHDANWFIIRLTEFHRMLRDGQFPVRFGTTINFGYGYPVFTFVYPLPLMILEAIHVIGIGFVDSFKILLALTFPLSGLGMFLWMRRLTGHVPAALSASTLYLYAPYRFVDIYVRGSFGEATSFIFPPWVLWGVEMWIRTQNSLGLLVAGVGTAAVLLSHNIMAAIFSLWIAGYVAIRLWQQKQEVTTPIVASLLLGVGASLFFWVPALVEKNFVQFDRVFVSSFFGHFPTFQQLLFSPWGYGRSVEGIEDGMSFQVGIVHLLLFLTAVSLILLRKKYRQKLLIYGIVSSLVALLLMLEGSAFLWKIGEVHRFVQHPWRLLALTTFSMSMVGGLILGRLPYRRLVVFGSIALVLSLSIPMAKPETYEDKGDAWYATNDSPTTIADEYMPVWVRDALPKRATARVEMVSGIASVAVVQEKSNVIEVEISSRASSSIRINTIDYPGWRAKIDGQPVAIERDPRWGFMHVRVPKGDHRVRVAFGETGLRLLADVLSVISLAGLCVVSRRGRII